MIPTPTDESPYTLVRGDSLQLLEEWTPPEKAFVLCDPPYGIALNNHSSDTTWSGSKRVHSVDWKIDGDKDLQVAGFLSAWAGRWGLPVVLFASPYKPLPGEWRNILAWDKGPAVGGGGDPSTCWKRTFELIYIRDNGPLQEGRDGAVLNYPVSSSDFDLHPCQKPLPLLRYLIKQICPPDAVVIDPCCGSGSTLAAALLEGRKCIGIEIDPKHHAVAAKRLKRYTSSYLLTRGLSFADSGRDDLDLFGHPTI